MTVEQLAKGLWYWTAGDRACVYFESPEAVVLIDPVVPGDEEERFWHALDRDVARLGLPVRVLLTAPGTGAEAFVARYGATVGGDPPTGVEALAAGDARVYFIREGALLVAGDVVHLTSEEPGSGEFLAWPFEHALIAREPPFIRERAEVVQALRPA